MSDKRILVVDDEEIIPDSRKPAILMNAGEALKGCPLRKYCKTTSSLKIRLDRRISLA